MKFSHPWTSNYVRNKFSVLCEKHNRTFTWEIMLIYIGIRNLMAGNDKATKFHLLLLFSFVFMQIVRESINANWNCIHLQPLYETNPGSSSLLSREWHNTSGFEAPVRSSRRKGKFCAGEASRLWRCRATSLITGEWRWYVSHLYLVFN